MNTWVTQTCTTADNFVNIRQFVIRLGISRWRHHSERSDAGLPAEAKARFAVGRMHGARSDALETRRYEIVSFDSPKSTAKRILLSIDIDNSKMNITRFGTFHELKLTLTPQEDFYCYSFKLCIR